MDNYKKHLLIAITILMSLQNIFLLAQSSNARLHMALFSCPDCPADAIQYTTLENLTTLFRNNLSELSSNCEQLDFIDPKALQITEFVEIELQEKFGDSVSIKVPKQANILIIGIVQVLPPENIVNISLYAFSRETMDQKMSKIYRHNEPHPLSIYYLRNYYNQEKIISNFFNQFFEGKRGFLKKYGLKCTTKSPLPEIALASSGGLFAAGLATRIVSNSQYETYERTLLENDYDKANLNNKISIVTTVVGVVALGSGIYAKVKQKNKNKLPRGRAPKYQIGVLSFFDAEHRGIKPGLD